MTTETQLEILDVRHFTARQLRPLLESEAAVWQRRLRWNYRESTELLLQYLDSRVLPGFVALERGRVCGFTFCVYEGRKAVIGDAYAVDGRTQGMLAITQTLLGHMLEVLEFTPMIDRVESQLLLFDAGVLEARFVEAGFTSYRRLFMECDLEAAVPGEEVPITAMELRAWSAADYQAAAELIHDSYRDHVDALINDQYRTLHGALRFLHSIVRFPGCGVFEPEQSWVLRDGLTGDLAGILLCSRVAEDVMHITQLCVVPAYRGRGLGRRLLRHCMRRTRAAGFAAITLTVTEENRRAVELYEEFRFFARQRFDAMVLDRSAGGGDRNGSTRRDSLAPRG
jgi:ribosomal protein S18 acetylase RimI-like enzyme